MTKIILDKNYYTRQQEIVDWCKNHISKNYGWRQPNFERWGDSWGIESNFGYSIFYFINDADATYFRLVWE